MNLHAFCFRDDDSFLKVGSDILEVMRCNGLESRRFREYRGGIAPHCATYARFG